MTTRFNHLKKRVERIENVLIGLALHPNKCKYIYIEDLKESLLRRRLVKEKTLISRRGRR